MLRNLILIFILILTSCSEEELNISGTYSNQEIQLNLNANGSQINGTLTQNGVEYPIKGEVEGNSIKGSFKVGDDSFSFSADISDQEMNFATGDTKYKLQKKAATNPLAKAKENPLAKKEESVVEKNTKTYQIENSFIFFDYPKDWEVSTQENFLSIVPNDLKKDANGEPDEIFLLSVTPANGFQLQSDTVQQFFTQLVNQQFNNSAAFIESGTSHSKLGAGRTLTFSVKSDEGKDATVTFYCSIYNNVSFYLEHAAINDHYNNRTKDAELIFNSLRFEEKKQTSKAQPVKVTGDRDPQLVSAWRHRSNAGNGVVYTESSTKALFQANGKVFWGTGTFISADSGGYSAISKPGQNAPDEGVWTTKGNVIYITWSNGNKSQYQYSVFDYDGTPAVKMIINGNTLYFKKY